MGLLQVIRSKIVRQDLPLVVEFAGGMGAQIISAAIYFSMKYSAHPVYADFAYFRQPERIAEVGKAGMLTHWGWKLDLFGLYPSMFEVDATLNPRNARYLTDGQEKIEIALRALSQQDIRDYFKVTPRFDDVLPGWNNTKYLCIHVRRGDYLNVASHLVNDEKFVAMARKLSRLVERAVILSESTLSEGLRSAFTGAFKEVRVMDPTDAASAHRIMRHAHVLIGSNSQFSLVAAALNTDALTFVPTQWFDGSDRLIERPVHARCNFEVFDIFHEPTAC